MKLEEDFYQTKYMGYFVSKSGKLLSYRREKPKIMKGRIDLNGYQRVTISNGNCKLKKEVMLHRIVLDTFSGEYPHLEANHLNGKKSDNRLANLEWVTRSENGLHKSRILKKQIGSDVRSSKLKNDDILEIRKLLKSGVSQKEIAKNYGVHKSCISLIKLKKNWGWLK